MSSETGPFAWELLRSPSASPERSLPISSSDQYKIMAEEIDSSVPSRFGPVDKHKNSAETHRGPSRIINWEIAKDGRKMTFCHPLKI